MSPRVAVVSAAWGEGENATATALTECVVAVEPYSVRDLLLVIFRADCSSWRRNVAEFPLKGYWRASVAPLGLLAFLASGSMDQGMAQTAAQSGNRPDNLGPIVAIAAGSQADDARVSQGAQRSRTSARVAGRPRPQTAVVSSCCRLARPAPQTPLNTNVVTEVGSRLGLTARQTPATVEVIDKQVIEDRGLRTTTDIAKAAVGVTGGDAPGAPAIFSMRGFCRRPDQYASTTISGSVRRP